MKLVILLTFLAFPYLLYLEPPTYTGDIPCDITFYSDVNQEIDAIPFTYKTDCELSELEVEVFNQWGENIYGSNDLNLAWYGKRTTVNENGDSIEASLPLGTYYYIAKYKFEGGDALLKQGGTLRIAL